jgi:membrane-bound metal-dependent hydrolase YbcI (DUF457 family)
MNLWPHAAMSAAAGAGVWLGTGEINALPAALAAGVLPDIDHIPDYYLRYVRHNWNYLFVLFHGWEYAAAGLIAYLFWVREPWMLAVLLGYLTQIGADQLTNRVRWDTYLVTARAVRGFRANLVLGREDRRSHNSFVDSLPFGKARARAWFEARSRRP